MVIIIIIIIIITITVIKLLLLLLLSLQILILFITSIWNFLDMHFLIKVIAKKSQRSWPLRGNFKVGVKYIQ